MPDTDFTPAIESFHRNRLAAQEATREFRRRLNEARAHFGTATTPTQIPNEHREASRKMVLAFFDAIDPDRG